MRVATRQPIGGGGPVSSLPVLAYVVGCTGLSVEFLDIGFLKGGNLTLLGGCALAILMSLRRWRVTGRPRLAMIDYAFLAYLAFLALSAQWAPSRAQSAVQLVFLSMMWSASFAIGREGILTFVRYFVYTAFVISILSLLAMVIAPDMAYQPNASSNVPELRGILLHQLLLGLYAGTAAGLLFLVRLNGELGRIFENPRHYYICLPILTITSLLAVARLYTLAVVLSLVLTFGLTRRGWRRYVSFLAIALVLALVLSERVTFMEDLAAAGVDITLTGRTRIWEKTLDVAQMRPLFGHGYPSFDSAAYDWIWAAYRPAHPHNGYIQAYFETGLIGLALLLFLVYSHVQSALKYAGRERRYSYTLFIVSIAVLGSLTGAIYGAKPSVAGAFALLAVSLEVRRWKVQRAPRKRNAPGLRYRRPAAGPMEPRFQ